MSGRRNPPKKMGMDLQQCVARADYHLKRADAFLLIFDIVDSRSHPERLISAYHMVQHLNRVFACGMPENRLRNYADADKGFVGISGDKGVCGVASVDVVRQIIKYQTFAYPDIQLRWVVAEDGWDPEAKRI